MPSVVLSRLTLCELISLPGVNCPLQEYADDSSKVAVMTEADPDQCIMALINDR